MEIKENSNLQILKSFKNILIDHFENDIKHLILFGSQATGQATKFSDYDLLIILNNDYDWKYRDKITDIIYDFELEENVLFDIHLLSVRELEDSAKGAEPIFENALKDGIYI